MEGELNNLNHLMQQAQAGDKTKYNTLLKTIMPMIRGFIINHLGDGLDTEDILQETLIAIHKSSHTYNTDRPFKNWMFAIANYKVKDYLRVYYRKKTLEHIDFEKIKQFGFVPTENLEHNIKETIGLFEWKKYYYQAVLAD